MLWSLRWRSVCLYMWKPNTSVWCLSAYKKHIQAFPARQWMVWISAVKWEKSTSPIWIWEIVRRHTETSGLLWVSRINNSVFIAHWLMTVPQSFSCAQISDGVMQREVLQSAKQSTSESVTDSRYTDIKWKSVLTTRRGSGALKRMLLFWFKSQEFLFESYRLPFVCWCFLHLI